MPVNYQLGKIYKIESYQTDDFYIGSSCEKYLSNRLAGHKKHYNRWLNNKYHYVSSFDILKYDDAFITLIESYPCNSKEELHKREGYWIRELECVNKNIAGRKQKEYIDDNKLKYKQIKQKYVVNNKSKVIESKKNWLNKNPGYIKYYHQARQIDKMMEKVKYENYKIDVILSEYSYFIKSVLSTFD